MAIAIGVIVVLLMAGGGIWAWRDEIRRWNHGIAPCGERWIQFATDSQGGRMYHCESGNCRHGVDISYPGVDR